MVENSVTEDAQWGWGQEQSERGRRALNRAEVSSCGLHPPLIPSPRYLRILLGATAAVEAEDATRKSNQKHSQKGDRFG